MMPEATSKEPPCPLTEGASAGWAAGAVAGSVGGSVSACSVGCGVECETAWVAIGGCKWAGVLAGAGAERAKEFRGVARAETAAAAARVAVEVAGEASGLAGEEAGREGVAVGGWMAAGDGVVGGSGVGPWGMGLCEAEAREAGFGAGLDAGLWVELLER